jgi:hypothetical protein
MCQEAVDAAAEAEAGVANGELRSTGSGRVILDEETVCARPLFFFLAPPFPPNKQKRTESKRRG